MDMEKFKKVMDPLVNKSSSEGSELGGINFMEILGNPEIMNLV